MSSQYEFLIVGQGIAGTSLAWHLHQRGKTFLLIDAPSLPSSSHVAAGIFNPLTGRKLVKTWLADTLFPYAVRFYETIQHQLGIKAVHHTDIFRPYRNEVEKANYERWTNAPSYQTYISKKQNIYSDNNFIHAPHNGLTVTRSGWLNLPLFLNSSREYFRNLGCFLEAEFSSQELEIQDRTLRWRNWQFSRLVNCMGLGAQDDPLFNWLPFNPVKGQLLDCTIEGYDIEEIVNQGIFILPLGNGTVRVGATYSWHDLNWETTEDGRNYLSSKLSPLLKVPYTIEKQAAGIRPSSKDRRPFVGQHPEYSQIFVLNGLGTKGVTLAPYFAGQLINLLFSGQELDQEANISRYFSLYSKPRIS